MYMPISDFWVDSRPPQSLSRLIRMRSMRQRFQICYQETRQRRMCTHSSMRRPCRRLDLSLEQSARGGQERVRAPVLIALTTSSSLRHREGQSPQRRSMWRSPRRVGMRMRGIIPLPPMRISLLTLERRPQQAPKHERAGDSDLGELRV